MYTQDSSQEHFTEMVALLDQAIALDGSIADAFNVRGLCHIELDHYNAAMVDFDKAIELESDYDFYNNRGIAWHHLGNFDKALEDFNASIKLESNAPESHWYRAICFYDHGDYKNAKADLERAVKLAVQRDSAEDKLESMDYLARLLATCPDAKIRDGARAVNLAQQVVDDPEGSKPFYLDTLAAAHAEAGNFSKAAELQTEAIEESKKILEPAQQSELTQRLELYRQGQAYRSAKLRE